MTRLRVSLRTPAEVTDVVRSVTAGLVTFDGCTSAGKTTLAATVSKELGLPLVDLDDYVVRNEGHFVNALRSDELKAKIETELAQSPVVLVSGVCMQEVLRLIAIPAATSVYVQRNTAVGLPGDLDFIDAESGIEAHADILQHFSELDREVYAYHRDFRPRSRADVVYVRVAD